jgi:DNA mismatch repair protein MutS2
VNAVALPTLCELVRRTKLELDWPLLLQRIAYHAISAAAVRSIGAWQPEANYEAACERMRLTAQALDLYESGHSLPVENFPDTAELLERVERGTVATGLELRDIALLLEQARRLRAAAKEEHLRRPLLAAVLDTDPSLERIAERLASSLEADGALSDSASPELARARRKLSDARRELTAQLRGLLTEYADILRESYWAERGGRYVLPLRSDAHRALDGAVLDSSGSGGTLYVEPRELLPFNNKLRVCEAEVHHEEQRVLRQLSDLIARSLFAVRAAESACIVADELNAIARYGERVRGVAIVPITEPLVELRDARHPLLAERDGVVANDITLPAATSLVISGPNAGGKTVILKLVGLAAWMVRTGIPLPVAVESRMGFFDPVVCNLGDAQSITSSLSTFSAHVTDLSATLSVATPSALVLLDEVAAGTDPEEGAALAAAVLEALTERGATVLTTTHHEPLKELATQHPRLRSAAVGFDLHTMLPTFRLLPNLAGPSTALAVASRFGMPEAVVERAHALIPKTSHDRERLLRELHAERSAAEEMRRQIEAELTKQRSLRLQMEQERDAFEAKESRDLQAKYRDLVGAVVRARAELAQLEKRLKHQTPTAEGLREAQQAIDAAAHVVSMGSSVSNAAQTRKATQTQPRQLAFDEVAIGTKVHVPQWGVDAEVVEVSTRNEVKVAAGSLRAWFSPQELRVVPGQSRRQPSPAKSKKQRASPRAPAGAVSRATPMRVDSNTLDLRGARVDEALDQLDAFVDRMLSMGQMTAFVLHGHGTGALKQAVREHLRLSAHVADSAPAEPEDGGDAFTVLWLPD